MKINFFMIGINYLDVPSKFLPSLANQLSSIFPDFLISHTLKPSSHSRQQPPSGHAVQQHAAGSRSARCAPHPKNEKKDDADVYIYIYIYSIHIIYIYVYVQIALHSNPSYQKPVRWRMTPFLVQEWVPWCHKLEIHRTPLLPKHASRSSPAVFFQMVKGLKTTMVSRWRFSQVKITVLVGFRL